MLREIVLDTETTGFKATNGDRIVEIGCIELINHIPSGKDFQTYINPERDMPDGAFSVHGLSEEFLADKPLFHDIATDFLSFIDDAPLIIHNAPFDMGFLNFELKKMNIEPIKNKIIDTVLLARKIHPGARVSLDALCKHYGVNNSHRTLHGALLDSQILAEIYLELIGGRQVGLSLSENILEESQNQEINKKTINLTRTNRLEDRISEQEEQAHKDLIENMGENAMWTKLYSK
ncbi:MAG: DNA polymerase III subunit epsilon [Devosiaceae bacterium]|nr:DNA polymerase III subunit epsilon [Devosiaceae bacterium]